MFDWIENIVFLFVFSLKSLSFFFLQCMFLHALIAKYPVSRVFYKYAGSATDLPNLNNLRLATVSLGDPEEEVSLGLLIDGRTLIRSLSHRDLFKLSEVPLHYLKDNKLEGMVAFPSPEGIDPSSGEDLRPPGDTSLTIMILVSRLGSVSVRSEDGNHSSTRRISKKLESLIDKNELSGKPIRKDLMDTLKRFGSHSSRSARVLLSAREETDLVDAVLSLKKRPDSPKFLLSASNTGTESTGEWLFAGAYSNDQFTGRDDAFGVSYVFSNTLERHAAKASYYLPFSPGKTLGMNVALGYSTYDASTFSVTTIDFDGNSFFLDLALEANPSSLIGESVSLGFEAGLNFENVSAFNSITGSASLLNLTPRLGLSLQSRHENRVGKTSLLLKGNVNGIDQSDQLALGGMQTTDTYARLVLSHNESWRVGRMLFADSGPYLDRHLFSVKMEASWSLGNQRHLPYHQFITGGSHSVRGYPESIAAGDSGYLFSLQYRIPFYLYEGEGNRDLYALSLIPFLDVGLTQVNDPFAYESDHTLIGLGFGLEFQLPYGAYARIDFAKPLEELHSLGAVLDGTKSDDYRIHGNVRWKF